MNKRPMTDKYFEILIQQALPALLGGFAAKLFSSWMEKDDKMTEDGYTNVEMTCPYCEHVSNYAVPIDTPAFMRRIYECDGGDGGCDRDFVVKIKWIAELEIKTIDGETEKPLPPRVETEKNGT